MSKGFILSDVPLAQFDKIKHYSNTRLLEAAQARDITLQVVNPHQVELVVTREDRRSILIDDCITELPDFVIPRTGSDTTYYEFSVMRQLERMGVYLCNDSNAVMNVKDKLQMHQILAHSRLPTPKTMLAKYPINVEIVKREIGFPLIIKNVTGTQGAGIFLCESADKFDDIIELIYSNNPKANLIIQEFIQASYGKDLRVFVIGGRAVACMHRVSHGSFKANFSKGGEVLPFEMTPEIEWLATETAKILRLDVAGVDLLFSDKSFKICEANSAPGFHGLEQVVGENIAEKILDYIRIRTGVY